MQSRLESITQLTKVASGIVFDDSRHKDHDKKLSGKTPLESGTSRPLDSRQPRISKPEQSLLSHHKATEPPSITIGDDASSTLATNDPHQGSLCTPPESPDSVKSGSDEYFDAQSGLSDNSDTRPAWASGDTINSDCDYFDARSDNSDTPLSTLSQTAWHDAVDADQRSVADTPTPIESGPTANDTPRPGKGKFKHRFKRLMANMLPSWAAPAKAKPPANESPPAATPPPAAKSSGSFKDYLLRQGLELARDPLIQRALANAISKVAVTELHQAAMPGQKTDSNVNKTRQMMFEGIQSSITSQTDEVIDKAISCSAAHILDQDDTRYLDGFAKSIRQPVRQLIGEFYRQQLDWAYHTEEGRRSLQETVAQFISEQVESAAITLTGVKPEAEESTLPEFLHQKVSSGCQYGAALLQERLATLASSAASRQFIDDMVMQLVADGSDKLHGSFDDLQARIFDIIRNALKESCTALLEHFEVWEHFDAGSGYIRLLRDDMLGQIAHETTIEYNQIGDRELLKRLPKELILKKILRWLAVEAYASVRNAESLPRMVDGFMDHAEPQIKSALQEQVRKIQWLASQHHQHGQNFSSLANRLALNEAIKKHGQKRPIIQHAAATGPTTGLEASKSPSHERLVLQSGASSVNSSTLPPLQPAELQAIGQSLVGALQVGLQTVDDQRQAIETAITPRLEELVYRAFTTAKEHGDRWLTDEQHVELMEATLPWCQTLTKKLLHEGFMEGLQTAREWLGQDSALTTLTGALTPPSDAEPATDLTSLIIPRVRSAIDQRLDATMARVLREGAQHFQSSMDGQQFLAYPVLRNALDNAISKAIQTITVKADEQLDTLAEEVLPPVQAMLQQELVTIGPASIRYLVSWLRDEDHSHDLMAALLPGFEPLIARILSEVVAVQLSGDQDPAALQEETAPWLSGLTQQLLTPAVNYSLKRVIDWAEGHQQAFENLIQPQLAQTLDAVQPLMLEAIKKRLTQLQTAMAGNAGVAQNALRLADQLAPDDNYTAPEAVKDDSFALAPDELESISTDLAAALQLGLDEVLRHEDAIRERIDTGVKNVVEVAVHSSADYVAHQVAEDDAGALQVDQFTTATAPWCQQLATTLVSEALTEGFKSSKDWQLQPLIHNALSSALDSDTASDTLALSPISAQAVARLQPIINTALDQVMATVLHRAAHQLQSTLDSQKLFNIPAVRDAVDSTLRTAICDGVIKTEQHLESLTENVLTPVTKGIAKELLAGQMTVITQVLTWLDNEENARQLIATVTPGIRSVINRTLKATLTDKLADAAPLRAVLQPALLKLVDTMLEPTAGDILAWVVNWARQQQLVIVEQIQQEVEQVLAVCQPEIIKAIEQRTGQLLSTMTAPTQDSTTTRALSLAQQLVSENPDQPLDNPPFALQTSEVDALGNALSTSILLALRTLSDQQQTITDTLQPHLERVVARAVTAGSEHLARQIAGDDAATLMPERFSHATTPWCQKLASDLLSHGLTQGLTGALSWADDGARQAITSALTSTDEQTSAATGALLTPHIQQALDKQLDQVMADLLRRTASGWQTTVDSNQLLSQPLVQTLLDQQVRQAINSATTGMRNGLAPLSEAVLVPLREQLKEELPALQAATLDKSLSWLQNPEQTRDIMATLLPPVADIITRVLSETLAAQLDESAQTAITPMLNGLVRHLLPPAFNYAVQRLAEWSKKNPQRIIEEITPQIEQTLDAAQPLLLTAIDERLKQLQTVAAEENVAARAVALADRLAPASPDEEVTCRALANTDDDVACRALATADESVVAGAVVPVAQPAASEPHWLESILPEVSQGITTLVRQAAERIGSEPNLVATLVPQLQQVINAAISSSTAFVNQRLAEPADGDMTPINQAVASHLQEMVAGYLSQGVASGIEKAVAAITDNPDELSQSIEALLRQQLPDGERSTSANTPLTQLIDRAIDLALDKQALLAGINSWIADNAATATPQLHQAMDKVLSHIMANIGEFLSRHKHGIATEILPEIRQALTQSLVTAQTDLISNVCNWLSTESNRTDLVANLMVPLQSTITDTVSRALARQLGGQLPDTVAAITPTVAPLVDKALDRALQGIVGWLSQQLPTHQQQICALTEPLISATLDKAMPAVEKAVQNKALVMARGKAQDIDFNGLATELAAAFAEDLDLDSATDGAIKVGPGTNISKELPRLLCLLMHSAETFTQLGGSFIEPVSIDHLTIGEIQFNNIVAQLTRKPDGSVQIQQMGFVCRDKNGVNMEIALTGVTLRPQWPESSKLHKAALLGGVSAMSPADAAASLFKAFTPDSIDIKIGHISGEYQDALLDGPHDDTVGFGLSDLELDVRLHKYYPRLYTDIRVRPKESIIASVRGEGLVEHIDATIKIDAHRNGYIDVRGQADPGRLNRLLRWLIGGKIHVYANIPVQNGIATLNDIDSITALTDRRFSGLCNAVLKNTLRANHPELTTGDDGKEVIKLKLALFNENRASPIKSWLARTANRVFRFFFSRPIEIRVAFHGNPYLAPNRGEKGLGSFNFSRFIAGMSPWPVSLQSETHRQLIHDLKTAPREARLSQLDKVIDHVIGEFRQGNAPSDLSLVREIPLEDMKLLVESIPLNSSACPRLLFLIACLTEALPEKAVQLVNICGFNHSRPYLLDLLVGTPRTEWLTNPDGTLMEPGYQSQQFKRLRQFWLNSENNPDGNIFKPDQPKGAVEQCGEKVAELVKQLGDKLDLPDELKLVLARDFDFASKLFKSGTSQDPARLPKVKSHQPLPAGGE